MGFKSDSNVIDIPTNKSGNTTPVNNGTITPNTLVDKSTNNLNQLYSHPQYKWIEIDESTDDPTKWKQSKKVRVMVATIFFCFLVSGASSSFAMGLESMVEDLNTSYELGSVAMALFVVGFAIGPMFFAGLSEELGRNFMYLITTIIYLLMFLPIALTNNIKGVIFGRLIQGLAASSGSTMVSGTIADLYHKDERGVYMSIFAFSAMFSTGLAPICYSYVPQNLSWRWIQWIQMIITGGWSIVMLLLIKETRITAIMKSKAKRLRKETGDMTLRAHCEVYKPQMKEMIQTSLARPLLMLVTEPIVASFSAFIGFAWCFWYALIASISHVFITLYSDNYGMDQGSVGFIYVALVIGSILGFSFNYFFQERWFYPKFSKTKPVEARLGSCMISGIIFPIGAYIYAFTSYSHVHWIAPSIAIAIILMGMFSIYLSSMSYLADCYGPFASSSLAAISLVRNMTGGIIIMVIRQWYDGMGFNYASLLVALIATLLAVIPFVLFFYGEKIRSRSKFSIAILKEMEANNKVYEKEGGDVIEVDHRHSLNQV